MSSTPPPPPADSEPVRNTVKSTAKESTPSARSGGTPALQSVRADDVPRSVRLSVSRVDPWSVMKLSFLLAVALGVMLVVASGLVWTVLDSMQVFAKMEDLLTELRVPKLLALMDFVQFDKVISVSTLVAVLNTVLLTALSTLMALIYNVVAALVGGFKVTMTDE